MKPESVAERLGFEYEAKESRAFNASWDFLPEVKRGGGSRHVMRRRVESGQSLVIFEHTYVMNTGQVVIPVPHVVYALETPAWPRLSVTPRGFFGRLMLRLGRTSGSLLLDEDRFNKAFVTRTVDEPFAASLLTPDLQQFLLTNPRGVAWRFDRGWACLIYDGKLRADRIERSLERLSDFWRRVPDQLREWEPARRIS